MEFFTAIVKTENRTQFMRFLTALWILLALVAVYFDWLSFPLTASLNAKQITWQWQKHFTFSLGTTFQCLISIGAVSMYCRKFFIALVCFSAALVVLLYFPWHAGFEHTGWLSSYVAQSIERLELYYFTYQYFVLNLISEPTFIPAKRFESLFDQAGIAVNMMSVGWYSALLANVMLLTVLLQHWRFPFQLPITLVLIISFGLLPVYRTALDLLQAGKVQNQGNQHLLYARASQALHNYKQVLKLNPVLSHSAPFLIKVADAYAIQTNNRHPLSKISEAWIIIQQNRLLKNNVTNPINYRKVRMLVQQARENHVPKTALEKALDELAQHLNARLWRYEALSEYARGNLHKAMDALQRGVAAENQLTSRFYLATLHIKLNDPLPALSLLQPYVDQVAHPSVKADIYCTIGDAYTRDGQAQKARAAYLSCIKWDNIKNYRVIRALSGF